LSDPFPALAESAATGETAELFADIRAIVGVRVVNLVWRHLGTIDGALPWAWAAVKPLYLQGMPDQAAIRFRESMALPELHDLAGPEPKSFALGALVAWLRGETASTGTPERGPRLRAPDVALPMLASPSDVAPETWALVLRLNRFGDKRQLILASMYRHLAHAPLFLRRVEAALGPVDRDGSLVRAIAANRAEATARARMNVAAFVDQAIGKMVTICRAIRVARGNLS